MCVTWDWLLLLWLGKGWNFNLEEVGQWKWKGRTRTTYDVFVEGREKGNCHLPFDTDSYSFQLMGGCIRKGQKRDYCNIE